MIVLPDEQGSSYSLEDAWPTRRTLRVEEDKRVVGEDDIVVGTEF
jgi:hypothetical protein